MDKLKTIKVLINEGDTETAIAELNEYLATGSPWSRDEAYYLLGNAFRKQGNWQLALNNYQSAIDINSDSPAVEARKSLMDILNFYNKDMYNQ